MQQEKGEEEMQGDLPLLLGPLLSGECDERSLVAAPRCRGRRPAVLFIWHLLGRPVQYLRLRSSWQGCRVP